MRRERGTVRSSINGESVLLRPNQPVRAGMGLSEYALPKFDEISVTKMQSQEKKMKDMAILLEQAFAFVKGRE